jgi:shikimate dehydrogenase
VEGEWFGANTDVPGMAAALDRVEIHGSTFDEAVVLGGGATAASAIAALRERSVGRCVVCVRRPKASAYLEEVAGRVGVGLEVRSWDDVVAACARAPLVVSTTPAGATDTLAGVVEPADGALLFDVVYAPWPTPLAAAWSSRGGQVIGGLELLVQQAALQVRLMTGLDAPVDVMRAAGEAALGRAS